MNSENNKAESIKVDDGEANDSEADAIKADDAKADDAKANDSGVEDTIEKLEQRITDMINLCEKISRENELLKTDQRMLRQEFTALQEKNKIARGRIEQIVNKLKSLEP